MKDLDKVDKRVERTRNAIINAFKELIIEKEFKEITIKELAEKANINRKTFYLHYESMEEILFDLSIEISEQLLDTLNSKGFFNKGTMDIEVLIDSIDELITQNYELTRKLVSANSYRFFSRNIKDLVKDSFIRKIKLHSDLHMDPYVMNLVGDYIGSGLAKLLKDWFEDHGQYTSKDIAKIASAIIFGGIKGAIELKM